MTLSSGRSDHVDEPPAVGRPRGVAWRALQADGVLWEGQVLLLGQEVDLAARLIATAQRLAFVRGGNIVLDVPRAWVRTQLARPGDETIHLSIRPDEPGSETTTLIVRAADGPSAASRLVGLITPSALTRVAARPSRPGEPVSAPMPPVPRPSSRPVPPGPPARSVAPGPVAVGANLKPPLWGELGEPAVPRRIASTEVTRPTWPETSAERSRPVDDEVRLPAPHGVGRDHDWNLQPMPGMVHRTTRRRRGWALRLVGLVVLLAMAAFIGSGRMPSRPAMLDDDANLAAVTDLPNAADLTASSATTALAETPTVVIAAPAGADTTQVPEPTAIPQPPLVAEGTSVTVSVGGGSPPETAANGSDRPGEDVVAETAVPEPTATEEVAAPASAATEENVAAEPTVPTATVPPSIEVAATEPPLPTSEPPAPTATATAPVVAMPTAPLVAIPPAGPIAQTAPTTIPDEPTMTPLPPTATSVPATATMPPTATVAPTVAPEPTATAVATVAPEPTQPPAATATTAPPAATATVEPGVVGPPIPDDLVTPVPTTTPAPTAPTAPTATTPPTATAEPTTPPSPTATVPVPTQEPSLDVNEIPDQALAGGPFRYTIEVAQRGESLPEFALPPNGGEWVALIVQVQNTTDQPATLTMSDFTLVVPETGALVQLDVGTSFIAGVVGIDPPYGPGDLVAIAPGEGVRVALVYLLALGTGDVALSVGGSAVDLSAATEASIGVGALAEPKDEPAMVSATVQAVPDGQSLAVVIDGVPAVVRYLGIETPVEGACYAADAAAANAALVPPGSTVLIERQRTDQDIDGRLLRDVWVVGPDGGLRLIAHELILSGAGVAAAERPNTRYAGWLAAAQSTAEASGAGQWGACAPAGAEASGVIPAQEIVAIAVQSWQFPALRPQTASLTIGLGPRPL